MKITITKATAFDLVAAWRIVGEIVTNPQAVVGLSTGRTTEGIHAVVCAIHRQFPFDVSGITLVGVDEVINVPRDYSGACYTMLKTQLTRPLGLRDEQLIMPPTISENPERECRLFQHAIEERGGIDLLFLGLGANGHIGFNQPGTPFESETHLAQMDEELERRIRSETHTPPETPLGGITLGIGTIMRSRKIVVTAKGFPKAEIIKKMVNNAITTDIPASVVRLHHHCELLLDEAAANYLK